MNILLWVLQGLLGLLFLFAGVTKFLIPYDDMMKDAPVIMPYWFILFIGACEVLGGLGLILPWLLKVKPGLTPLAAGLLIVIMIGATATSAVASPAMAIFPLIIGLLLAFVAYKRRGELALK
ncbi:MAG: DoxX family protein [Acidobacteriota bacterium]